MPPAAARKSKRNSVTLPVFIGKNQLLAPGYWPLARQPLWTHAAGSGPCKSKRNSVTLPVFIGKSQLLAPGYWPLARQPLWTHAAGSGLCKSKRDSVTQIGRAHV